MPLVPNYAPTDWVDTITPVDAARMDNIDTNLDLHADAINTLDTRLAAEEAMADIPTVVNGKWIKGVTGAMVWSDITQTDVSGLSAALTARELTANKGVVNGYAPLDLTGRVPVGNLPPGVDLRWMGAYSGTTVYKEGDIVIEAGVSYMALRPSTGETPLPWASGGGGGGGAVPVSLLPGAAILPDGSAGNFSPALARYQGSEASPKKHFLTLTYDGGSSIEYAWWTFRLPSSYVLGGVLKILWFVNATTGNVKWQAKVGAVTPADTDTPLEHASAAAASVTTPANTSEARRLTESSISLTMDSAAAGDLIFVCLFRDPTDAADTCASDVDVVSCSFEYS